MEDVFEVQDEIARSVVTALRHQLLPTGDERLITASTTDLGAYQLFLEGRSHTMRVTRAGLNRGLDCFHRAIEADPTYPDPHAGVAIYYVAEAIYGWSPPRDVVPKSKASAERALTLDSTNADAHYALGLARQVYDWDWSGAEEQLRRALECNPGHSDARGNLGLLLACLGRHEEAVQEGAKAVEMDPLSLSARHRLSRVFMFGRNFDEALVEGKRGLKLDPTYPIYFALATALVAKDDVPGALEVLQAGRTHAQGDPVTEGTLGWVLGLAGRSDDSMAVARQLAERREAGYCSACSIAWAYIGVGDYDEAWRWLSKAYDERDGLLFVISVSSIYDPLRSDPRFQALLRKMNFPQTAQS